MKRHDAGEPSPNRAEWEKQLLAGAGARPALNRILDAAEKHGNDKAKLRHAILTRLFILPTSTPRRRRTWLERANVYVTPKRLKGLLQQIEGLADELDTLNKTAEFDPKELAAVTLPAFPLDDFVRLPATLRCYARAARARARLLGGQCLKASRIPRKDVLMSLMGTIHRETGRYFDEELCTLLESAMPRAADNPLTPQFLQDLRRRKNLE